ncbi:MmcB family DNA repair protein [Paenibacillus sp. GYB004]|uniref:MmcB family DNA repair protein n=1 Tax=Paenibacillus sp. GYB004 TaxID=2994393 RepID=UPI002F96B67A
MKQQKIRADHLKQALSIRHKDDFFLTECKTGPTHINNELLIFDALAIKKSWANPCISGYEVKVSRSDFQRDNKWPGYLAYCNQFSFVCPTGLIAADELPPEVGLIYYNPEKQSMVTKRKALYRKIPIPVELLQYVIMSRLESDRHPFFSSRREYFERLREDESERKSIGYWVAGQTGALIKELQDEIVTLQNKLRRAENDKVFEGDVKEIMLQCGIPTTYGWQNRLRERLTAGVAGDISKEVKYMRLSLERLERLAGSGTEAT